MKILHHFPLPRKRTIAAFGCASALALFAGCSHVPILSIPALASIDFRTTQFQMLRAAIEMPDMLIPQPEAVRLNVELTIEDEVAEQRSYALIQTGSSDQTGSSGRGDRQGFPPEDGRHTFIYQLSDADQLGMESIRRAIFAAEAANQEGGLSLRVSVEDVCASAPVPDEQLLVDVFLMTSETGRFVRTLDGFDLRELNDPDVNLEQSIWSCQ